MNPREIVGVALGVLAFCWALELVWLWWAWRRHCRAQDLAHAAARSTDSAQVPDAALLEPVRLHLVGGAMSPAAHRAGATSEVVWVRAPASWRDET